ncbi:hybrid sensor histidine kinase/response regulator [Vibrio japonicus]|uniref:histidine kinase n=1 Tax=Vibrio japonicus TaxID=1824638 RepID=A0ABY5LNJ5_9VIBR|nr:hybrid sensor histidine kinase/response regulator [Vibrio japonicus]UUM32423.1 hybrid sensor histidine kinase/response regulator [Vibrio japonicus]
MSKLAAGTKMQTMSGATKSAIRKVYEYAEPNLTIVGWFGLLGFPIYYYVWSYLFPQPYESALLRGTCSVLFAVLVFRNDLPSYIHRYMPVLYLFILSLCLPFFFSYMMFKNSWSDIWAMSFLVSIFLHILLVHQTRVVLLQAAVSIAVAFSLAYGTDWNKATDEIVWEYVPVFMFTYVFGNLFYFRNQIEHESRVSIAKSFGASIAHEMRNPLAALKVSVEVLSSILNKHQAQRSEGISLSQKELIMAREILDDANGVIESGNEAIDLLLTSIDQNRVSTSTFKKHSMKSIVESALVSFAYKSPQDKQSIEFKSECDFDAFGSDTLIKYALYNLLKNSFCSKHGDGFKIDICLKKDGHYNHLIFRDNGVGIPADVIQDIFGDFYTYGRKRSSGLGLPFCKKVMKSLGGKIACRSELGLWTEFTLSFPTYESDVVDRIKMDLMKSKSVLFIGSNGTVSRALNEHAFYKGFRLINVSVDTAATKEAYEFEFDLIFVDLDDSMNATDKFADLENKLHFTEAHLVYLYDQNRSYPLPVNNELRICPIEINKLSRECGSALDALFFESPNTHMNILPHQLQQPKDYQGKTIVIADDNHSVRAYTSLLLEQQGFVVVQAKNGQDVLDTLNNQYVDLILMDIEMPSLNGLEAAERIRQSKTEYANVPIVAHTGDNSVTFQDKLQEFGINDYIAKPSSADALINKITSWV